MNPKANTNIPESALFSKRADESPVKTVPFNDASDYSDPEQLDSDFEILQTEATECANKQPKSAASEYEEIISLNMLRPPPSSELPSIKSKHHFVLIEWIFKASRELALDQTTESAAIGIFDRSLASQKVMKCHLQLFAVTSIWVACKLEETLIPSTKDLAFLCGDSYDQQEFVECERAILRSLKFTFAVSTPRFFISRWLTEVGSGSFYWALTVFERASHFLIDFGSTCAQLIASSSLFLAGILIKRRAPVRELILENRCGPEQIVACGKDILDAVLEMKKSQSDETLSTIFRAQKADFWPILEAAASIACDVSVRGLDCVDQ